MLALVLAPAAGRTVTGIVLDTACQPLPGATVSIEGKRPVVTDAKGRFVIRGLAGTSVTLRGQLQGFRSIERDSEPWSGLRPAERLFMVPARPLEPGLKVIDPKRPVAPAVPASNVPDATRLHGRVLDDTCRPLENASITVDGVSSAATDRDGRFDFGGITSGTHDVEIAATGFMTATVRGFVVDSETTGGMFVALDRGALHEKVTYVPR